MVHLNNFQISIMSNQVVLSVESVIDLLGTVPYEILIILRESYPEGKNFKDLKKEIEDRLHDWYTKKNKNTTFTDQAIYYQLRKIKELGFITTVSEKNLDKSDRLITSQVYKLNSLQFEINLLDLATKKAKQDPESNLTSDSNFMSFFNNGGKFNGFIVLGENSKDAPFLSSIFIMLSKFFEVYTLNNLVIYDTNEHKSRDFFSKNNLILLGGPNINTVFQSTVPSQSNELKTLHEILPVKFLHDPESGIVIRETGEVIYSKDRSIGVIQLIDNPWNPENKILTIGGARKVGTEALVNELLSSFNKIELILSKKSYCLVEAITNDKKQLVGSRIVDTI